MPSNKLSHEDVFEVLKIHGVPPLEAGNILTYIEDFMYITAGNGTVLIASVDPVLSPETVGQIIEAFNKYDVAVVLVPTVMNFDVKGTVTAKSWMPGFAERIAEVGRRMFNELRNA